MSKTESNILLFSITLCWAASYIFIKNLPENFSSYAYLALTTGIAAVIMAAIFWKQLKEAAKSTWLKGLLLSLILSFNLLAEKKGIQYMEAAEASFLSALTIIIVPLLLFLFHKKPTKNQLLGAGMILIGLCISSGMHVEKLCNAGAFYMLAGCFGSAVYTIAVDRYAKEEHPLLLCMIQMLFTAMTGFLIWFVKDPSEVSKIVITKELLSNIFVLAFFAKAYAYIVLMYAQKYTDAVSVTVIASTEPVITLLLAALLPAAYGGNRRINGSSVAGAVIIMLGAAVAGLRFLEDNGRRRKSDAKTVGSR